MKKTIGLIGIGAMGKALANKMLEYGIALNLWNRTREKMAGFQDKGATVSSSPGELIENSDAVLLMLTDATAINAVLSDAGSLTGKTIIQMSTISPSDSIKLAGTVSKKGGIYFEAPVLGSIPDINAQRLIIMVGGTKKNFEEWQWLFKVFGPKPLWVGPIGHAATLKLAMNQLIGSLTCAFSSSLGLILNNHINPDIFMEIVRASALYAPTYDKKLGNMLDHDFKNGNFSTKHLLKDLNLFINEAQKSGINVGSVAGVRDIVQATVDSGMGNDDYSSLYAVINKSGASFD